MKLKALLLAVMLAYGGSMPTAAMSERTTHSINHYELDVSVGYSIKDISPQLADFDLYEVVSKNRSRAKLTLYFGNHPDFPRFQWRDAPHIESKDGRTVKDFPFSPQTKRMEGLIAFSGLRYKESPRTPYSSIHYSADNLTENEARDFAEIVRSIRVARAHVQ